MSRSTPVSKKKAWRKYYFVNKKGVLRYFNGKPRGDKAITAAGILLELSCMTRIDYPIKHGIYDNPEEALAHHAEAPAGVAAASARSRLGAVFDTNAESRSAVASWMVWLGR